MSECLLYYLKEGVTRVGRPEAQHRPDIPLSGEHIRDEHCSFVNEDGTLTLVPEVGAECFVNGQQVTRATRLSTGSRVILGRNHVFRYNDPLEARQSRHNLAAAASECGTRISCNLSPSIREITGIRGEALNNKRIKNDRYHQRSLSTGATRRWSSTRARESISNKRWKRNCSRWSRRFVKRWRRWSVSTCAKIMYA